MNCNQCGTEFEGKVCPECGEKAEVESYVTHPTVQQASSQTQKQTYQHIAPDQKDKAKKGKKPFFLRWWFILLVIVIVGSIALFPSSNSEKIKWSDMELGDMIPEPPSSKGILHENSAENLSVSLEGVSDTQYNDYLDACENKGFTFETQKDGNLYKAFNAEGYGLEINHYLKDMSITLDAPMVLSSITWPTGTAGKLLPIPKSTIGKFEFEHDNSFFVYVGDISKADYDKYVATCVNIGFSVDYSKGDTYYQANNPDNWRLSLRYEGNHIMSVRIDAPDEGNKEISNLPETTESSELEEEKNNSTNLDPDFKTAMDSYEKFMDDYCIFMKKYAESGETDQNLLADYATYMTKYAKFCNDFEKWKDEEMSAAETAYYIEVQTRVNQKLLEVAG